MTIRLLARLIVSGLALTLLGGCAGGPAAAAPIDATADVTVSAAHATGTSTGAADGTAGIQTVTEPPTTDDTDAATAIPRPAIDRILTRAETVAARARDAANLLARTPIDQAKKARKKARAAAERLDRAAAALTRRAASPGATGPAVDAALATTRDLLTATNARSKAARTWAKRIEKRLAQCPVEARACVDLTFSISWLQQGGEVVFGPVKMASGRPGLRTRPGMWTVYAKYKEHVSGYYGLPMPYSIFFDHVGIAFHQGSMHELSHGCVHLTWKSSRAYWDFLRTGDKVFVFGYAPYSDGQITV